MTIFVKFAAHVDHALDQLVAAGTLSADIDRANVTVEPPRDASHGDLATNAAMVLAKPAGTNPRALAEALSAELAKVDGVTGVEIAGPGFLNLRLAPSVWIEELREIGQAGDDYGRSTLGDGKTVNIEYVSANPTGPMHMGHCRGAVVGDALASVLEFAGHKVIREYYINDAGGQVDTLARSVHLRYREALGESIEIPDGLYPGDYLIPVGQRLSEIYGHRYLDSPESEWLAPFRRAAVAEMMEAIKSDLESLGIRHDIFSSEAELHAAGKADEAEKELRRLGLIYEGYLEKPKGKEIDDWEPVKLPLFKSTEFGDDQDRPIKKSNGSWTYFGADLAYHYQKSRDADTLIDIWGMDHGGTVKRIKAAVQALTGGKADFDVKLVQMVKLLRNGEPVKMSKRSGSFVTLAEVVDEVGKDVVRFTMLTQKPEAPMEFDFTKVVRAQKDNSVFYVQYAHARIASTLRKGVDEGILPSSDNLGLLGADEITLIREAANFPRIVQAAAQAGEPHRIAYYLSVLAAAFHAYWNLGNDQPDKRFILAHDPALTGARLFMAANIGQVIRNGLRLMGVEAANSM